MANNVKDEMTPRERWIALLSGKTPDRVPTDYWATEEVTTKLKVDLGCPDNDSLWKRLHIDKVKSIWPHWTVSQHPDDPEADVWGCRYRSVDYGTGEYAEVFHNPLANAETAGDVHAFKWPSPDDIDYTAITKALDQDDMYYPIQCGIYEPFLLYANMRGMEMAYMDLMINPEVAEAALGHIFEFYYEYNRRCLEAAGGRADLFYLAEDLGSQHGPLFSPNLYRKFIMPNQKKMADLAHSHGAKVFYHTDGAARPFLPDLIDVVGIDILNPIQYVCPGMEREGLIKDFGAKVAFHGANENQRVLPFGSVEEVAQEVRENFEIFKGARWICAPCHNLQPVTPTENIVAMYETIYELRVGGCE